VLLHADDVASLHEAGIDSGPFGYFFAEIPRKTGAVRIVAFDARGKTIGTAGFDHLTGMGERFIVG
jgi:hypothetical protein